MNLSPALMLEYEAKLKTEALRRGRPLAVVERFLDFLARIFHGQKCFANRFSKGMKNPG